MVGIMDSSDPDDFYTDEGEINDENDLPLDDKDDDCQSSSNMSDNDDLIDDQRGLVGLQNLGNTCYINAALQALSNCQQLTRFVLDCPTYVKDSGLSRCYRDLIDELWNSKNSPYAVPASIIRNIKCIFPAFRGCTQQDTQEFLRCFLEQLHDELKQPATKKSSVKQPQQPNTSSLTTANSTSSHSLSSNDDGGDETAPKESAVSPVTQNSCDSQQQQTLPPAPSKPEEQRSIISDTFQFRISSSIVCSSCNNISTTKETFKDLSVPIPSRDHPYYQQSANSDELETEADDDSTYQNDTIPLARWLLDWFSQLGSWFWGPQVSLYDCLSVFFGTDPLDGDNQYSCEVCTKKNRGVKFLKILELPEVLCIHFKRYESVGSAKITSHVTFPLIGLDLKPFMSPNGRPQCTTYNLIACICHHGSALLTGHYTTYALNCYDDQWYEFDDQYVTCVSSYQVENSEAYILFYQKAPQDNDAISDAQRRKR